MSCSCRSLRWARSSRWTSVSSAPTTRIYGLTAGFFSDDREEVERFKEAIEAGVIYINRRAGATTGAWPGIQAFSVAGRAQARPARLRVVCTYVQQFMREQSQTLVD